MTKAEKLLDKFLRVPEPRDLTWDELCSIMSILVSSGKILLEVLTDYFGIRKALLLNRQRDLILTLP